MIRLGKPVQLLEWGKGTNTMNQRWEPIGNGTMRSRPKKQDGLTILEVEIEGALARQNDSDDSVKVMQQGEGMTPTSQKWGEVAYGKLKSVQPRGNKTFVSIELDGAIKVGNRS